jgi:L-seryl-tRNA(Ser) seleniumtransferase
MFKPLVSSAMSLRGPPHQGQVSASMAKRSSSSAQGRRWMVRLRVARGESQPGSGSVPGVMLPTWVVRVRREAFSAEGLAAVLRRGEPPVFARIQDDAVVLDPRTLLPGDEEWLIRAFEALKWITPKDPAGERH